MGIWGKVFAVTIISVILLSSGIVATTPSFAEADNKKLRVTLEDLGVL